MSEDQHIEEIDLGDDISLNVFNEGDGFAAWLDWDAGPKSGFIIGQGSSRDAAIRAAKSNLTTMLFKLKDIA